MKTLRDFGMDMLTRTAPKAMGGMIVYSDGASQVWIPATFGQTPFETTNSDSTIVEYISSDFLVKSDDLILNGKRHTPQRGDRITIVMEDERDNEIYEVLAPGGQKVFRTTGIQMRIHSKKVSV